jgi:hypothetical protein
MIQNITNLLSYLWHGFNKNSIYFYAILLPDMIYFKINQLLFVEYVNLSGI